jgi:hypothetical protein
MDFSKYVLFTGAGFTKNFGAPLATEIWYEIFNNSKIQSCSRIRDLLLSDFDYESIYYRVINGDYTKAEKELVDSAIYEAYRDIDKIVSEWIFRPGSANPINIYRLNEFIDSFSGQRPDMSGFFFTLNQDLFIERHFSSTMGGLDTLCIRKMPSNDKRSMQLPIEKQDFMTLPTEDQLIKNRKDKLSPRIVYYVKLHGSYGWLSSDGVNRFVIGKDKEVQLSREPLLSYYFDLFKKIISMSDSKLLVIGYGFRDKHINNVIADAVSNSGLKIYIISPSEQSLFIDRLMKAECGETILSSLKGYYPYTLLDIFPQDQSESHAWREIAKSYFVG